MLIAVPGGTGMLGRPVVDQLLRRGHDVRVISRTPPRTPQPGTVHRAVDLTTGIGLRYALKGVDAVVEAANTAGSGRKAAPVLVDGTRRLLEAEALEGVGHHVAISIVGIDDVPLSYYGAKLAQERLVEEGAVPWSIVRATQFTSCWTGSSRPRRSLGSCRRWGSGSRPSTRMSSRACSSPRPRPGPEAA